MAMEKPRILESFVPAFEDFSQENYFDRREGADDTYYNRPASNAMPDLRNPDSKSISWEQEQNGEWIVKLRGNVTGAMLDRWLQNNPKPEVVPDVNEKWKGDAEIEQTGEYAGKTIAELKKMQSALQDKKERTAEESTKLRQINFAIRAKRDFKGDTK